MFFNVNRALLFVTILAIFFNCGSGKTPVIEEAKHIFPERKAYVVLRSEGKTETLEKVKAILSSDFNTNNVFTTFSLYKAKQGWNQNKIFQTAYGDHYDYIILVDQIAKFTIDGRTQVGGKYQLRSYHIKSPNPDWLDLGQVTCNITVKPSIQKFSREIVRGIVGNRAEFKNHNFEYDDSALASNDNADVDSGDASNLSSEIERLKHELEAEKEKTRLAELEKRRVETQLKLQAEAQKEKTRLALLEEARIIEEKKRKEKEIARVYAAKREEIRQQEAEEVLKTPPVLVKSEPKEPTRAERLQARRDAKKRLADLKAEKKRQAEEANFKRQEERRRLAEAKRQDQRQLREALEAKRAREKRVAEQERLNKQSKDKVLAEQEKENKRLLEENRIAEQQRIEQAEQEARNIEDAKRSEQARLKEELKVLKEREERIAAQERINKQNEAERIAGLKAERIAEEKRQADLVAAQQRQDLALAESKKREKIRQAEILEQQRKEAELEMQSKEVQRIAVQKRIEQTELEARKKLEETRIAESKRKDELRKKADDEKKRLAEETKRQEEQEKLLVKQQKSKREERSSKSTSTLKTPSQVNALLIIRGKESDEVSFKALKDHLEFDFMFAKAKAQTILVNPEQSVSLDDVLARLDEVQNMAIVIDQLGYLGDGESSYHVKTLNRQSEKDWHDLGIYSYNLNLKESLKALSKKITEAIKN